MWYVWKTEDMFIGVLLGMSEGKGPHGRSRRRWEDSSGMDIREMGWEDVNCMYMVGFCEGGDETSGSIKCVEFLE